MPLSKAGSKEGSKRPSKRASKIDVVPTKKTSNGTVGKSSKNLPIPEPEVDGTNAKGGSVYDKYRQQFSKLANNKDIILKESEEETVVRGEKKKLTPMPQFQKAANSTISKDVFAKVERSAVMMRRMEYNAKMKKKKKGKTYSIKKVTIIQTKWKRIFKYRRIPRFIKIQSHVRAYIARLKFYRLKNSLIPKPIVIPIPALPPKPKETKEIVC